MAVSEKSKGKRDKASPFGQWMDEAAISKGTSLQDIAQYIGQEYAFVSRLYDGTKTPTYALAQQIGEMVEDADGALTAAGFDAPAPESKAPSVAGDAAPPFRRMLESGDEILLIPGDTDPDDTARRTSAFLVALRRERQTSG